MAAKSVLVRVPRDVDNDLKIKMPKYDSATRYRLVYDTSLVKLDSFLGKKNKTLNKLIGVK